LLLLIYSLILFFITRNSFVEVAIGLMASLASMQEGVMDNWTFAITMIVVGMGGTLLTLWILSLLMGLLKKAFPYKKEE
jgi:hypothetical protein